MELVGRIGPNEASSLYNSHCSAIPNRNVYRCLFGSTERESSATSHQHNTRCEKSQNQCNIYCWAIPSKSV